MCKRDLLIGLLVQLLALFIPVNSQCIERVAAGAREAALSQTVIALAGPFSVFYNQAFLTESKSPSLGISYRQPYFIHGYSESALSLVYPMQTAVFAVGVTQTSIATYKESTIGISIAKELTRKLSAGLLFNYFSLNFPEVSRHKGSFQVDGGIRYKHSDRLALGFHLRNIVRTTVETFQYNISFPLVIRGGASYLLTERILLAGEIVVEQHIGTEIHGGTEYLLRDNFRVRGGISTNPFQHTVGFGYVWNFCQLDFALVHHEILGYSPLFSVNFNF